MIRSLQCLISGKVQGVMFRSWTHGQATGLKLTGWVRNLSDGKVEILCQGDEEAIRELKKRLFLGPTLARVDDVECKWIEYDKEHSGFQIRT